MAGAWITTQFFIYFTWIPFRGKDVAAAEEIVQAVFGLRNDAGLSAVAIPYALMLAPILVDTFIVGRASGRRFSIRRPAWNGMAAVVDIGVLFGLRLFMMPLAVRTFIHFQF